MSVQAVKPKAVFTGCVQDSALLSSLELDAVSGVLAQCEKDEFLPSGDVSPSKSSSLAASINSLPPLPSALQQFLSSVTSSDDHDSIGIMFPCISLSSTASSSSFSTSEEEREKENRLKADVTAFRDSTQHCISLLSSMLDNVTAVDLDFQQFQEHLSSVNHRTAEVRAACQRLLKQGSLAENQREEEPKENADMFAFVSISFFLLQCCSR